MPLGYLNVSLFLRSQGRKTVLCKPHNFYLRQKATKPFRNCLAANVIENQQHAPPF